VSNDESKTSGERIERGRVVWSGSSPALADAPDVQHRYLGI
jgi:ABC-type branched-subunit amino acid transport system ATPase component